MDFHHPMAQLKQHTMKAVVLEKIGGEQHVAEVPIPDALEPYEILIKNETIAINPVDLKMAKNNILIKSYPIVLGCDVSGIVENVGSEVVKFKKGDKV